MVDIRKAYPLPRRNYWPVAAPVSLVIVYFAGWFLTYGYVWNRHECREGGHGVFLCDGDRVVVSAFSAFIWPVYWGMEGGKAVTR